MAYSMIELLRRLVRQGTSTITEPVLNVHGATVKEIAGVSLAPGSSWVRLTTRHPAPVSLEDFYRIYFSQEDKPHDVLLAVFGEVEHQGDGVTPQLYRTVVHADGLLQFPLEVEVSGTGSTCSIYVDGVLVRNGTSTTTVPIAVDKGDHLLEVLVVSPEVKLTLPASVQVSGTADVLKAPVWDNILTWYLDLQSGQPQVVLSWYTDVRVGGWRVLRRTLTELGVITDVGTASSSGVFGLTFSGDGSSILAAGSELLAARDSLGTVLVATYDDTSNTTNCRVQLSKDLVAAKTTWVGKYVATGVFTEIARVPRTAGSGTVEYHDTAVTGGTGYYYVLQALGLFDQNLTSPFSAIGYTRAGDIDWPGSIVIKDQGVPTIGYPTVRDQQVVVKFRTPSDVDYAGVRVYYRQSVNVTVTSVAGAVVGISPAVTASAYAGGRLRFTSGNAEGIEESVTSNTTSAVTLGKTFTSPMVPANGDTALLFLDTAVVTDYGVPNTDDELQFKPIGYGLYLFKAFDLAGNEQPDDECASWTYSTADDTSILTNVPPIASISQLTAADQNTFFGGGTYADSKKYAVVVLAASDPTQDDPEAGVTIYYQVEGSGTVQSLPAATTAPSGVVDNPAGTRSRNVLVLRTDETRITYWAEDAAGVESDRKTYVIDYDNTPEIVSVEYATDRGNSVVDVAVVVDDDTNQLTYWLNPYVSTDGDYTESTPGVIDTSTLKSVTFTVTVRDGQHKVLYVKPWASAGGATGEVWIKDLVQPPRTSVTFESRDESSNISGTRVRATVTVEPPRNSVYTATSAASGNTATTITPSVAPGWSVNAYQYSEALEQFYFVEITSGPLAGQVRKVTSNTATTLTFYPSLASNPNGVTFALWNAATIVRYGSVGGALDEVYVVKDTFYFDRLQDAATEFNYYSVLSSSDIEATHRVTVDADTKAFAAGLTVTETSPNVILAEVEDPAGGAAFDDDTKYWRLYARKATYPTTTGSAPVRDVSTGRYNMDDQYLRWEDTPNNTTVSFSAGTGTWYFVTVPYNSYNEDGDAILTQAAVVGSSEGVSGMTVTTPGSTTNRVNWTASNLGSPTTDYTMTIYASEDGGSDTLLTNTTLATTGLYNHTVGTRVSGPSEGTWHLWTYKLSLYRSGVLTTGPVTVSRGDYFAGGTISLTGAGSSVSFGGSGSVHGSDVIVSAAHVNHVTWSLSGVNDDEYHINVSCDVNSTNYKPVVTNVKPSLGEYYHSEDRFYENASGVVRTWEYKVDLIKNSDGSVVGTQTATLLSATVLYATVFPY